MEIAHELTVGAGLRARLSDSDGPTGLELDVKGRRKRRDPRVREALPWELFGDATRGRAC